jgi:hypothetical protein
MVLPTSAVIMVLLMLYQALAQLGIYLQKRVQLVLQDQLGQQAILDQPELRELRAQRALRDLKVYRGLRAQRELLALRVYRVFRVLRALRALKVFRV